MNRDLDQLTVYLRQIVNGVENGDFNPIHYNILFVTPTTITLRSVLYKRNQETAYSLDVVFFRGNGSVEVTLWNATAHKGYNVGMFLTKRSTFGSLLDFNTAISDFTETDTFTVREDNLDTTKVQNNYVDSEDETIRAINYLKNAVETGNPNPMEKLFKNGLSANGGARKRRALRLVTGKRFRNIKRKRRRTRASKAYFL